MPVRSFPLSETAALSAPCARKRYQMVIRVGENVAAEDIVKAEGDWRPIIEVVLLDYVANWKREGYTAECDTFGVWTISRLLFPTASRLPQRVRKFLRRPDAQSELVLRVWLDAATVSAN